LKQMKWTLAWSRWYLHCLNLRLHYHWQFNNSNIYFNNYT
jgi:hypothetical protein